MTATENGDRTHGLAKLPFRLVPDAQFGGHGIQFEDEVDPPFHEAKRRTVTYTIYTQNDKGAIPLPQILRLIAMYRELEANIAGITKERDDALAAKTVAEGEASRANSRVEEYKRQIANLKKDK